MLSRRVPKMNLNKIYNSDVTIKEYCLFFGIFVVLYISMVIITFVLLSRYHANFKDYIFNLHLFYSPNILYSSLDHLNDKLIKFYLVIAIIDVFIVILYAIFGTLLLRKIISLVTKNTSLQLFSGFFLLAGAFNLMEEAALTTIFMIYPEKLMWLATAANILTFSKLFCLSAGIVVSIVFIAIFLRRYYIG